MNRLASLLNVRADERQLVLLVATLFACIQAGQGMGDNAASALFLLRYGVNFLPYMYLFLGALTFITTLAYSAALGRLDKGKFFSALIAIFIGLLILERVAILFPFPLLYPILWLTVNGVSMILGTFVWNIAGEVCDARQAKRLFPLFTSAGILGSVVGNAVTGVTARLLGTDNLLLLYAVLLGFALYLTRTIGSDYFHKQTISKSKSNLWDDLRAGFDFVRVSPLLRLIAYTSIFSFSATAQRLPRRPWSKTMTEPTQIPSSPDRAATRALSMSTIAFTVCFAVWTIFSIIGVKIKAELGLSETQFGLLIGMPILTGSLVRIVLGVWTDRFGGRLVCALTMLAAAAATFLLAFAQTYSQMLLAALGVGLAGGSFAVGVAYVSRFYPAGKQGTALGIFGVGNVGAAVTKFVAPFALLAWGWQSVALIWAAVLVVMAVVFWFATEDDPVIRQRRSTGTRLQRSFLTEFVPLKDVRVWRFALYYFFAFGAFVALALWLPRYLIGVYGFDIATAGMIGAAYSIPASIFRAYGGVLSDRVGARTVLYWTFAVSAVALAVLSLPTADYVVRGINGPINFHVEIGATAFIAVSFVLGFFMSLGKAAVYKHIPVYYPQNVGAVGGLVGMIGGLGGFILPIAFGALNDLTGVWSSCFMLLFVIVAACFLWMHVTVRKMSRAAPVSTPAFAQAAE